MESADRRLQGHAVVDVEDADTRLRTIERLLEIALDGGNKMRVPRGRGVSHAGDWMTVADALDEVRALLGKPKR